MKCHTKFKKYPDGELSVKKYQEFKRTPKNWNFNLIYKNFLIYQKDMTEMFMPSLGNIK